MQNLTLRVDEQTVLGDRVELASVRGSEGMKVDVTLVERP